MESLSQKIIQVLGSNCVYSIPPYQRQYQWNEDLWQALVHDIAEFQEVAETEPSHWLGILLLTTDEGVRFPNDDSLATYSVIDGQQRLVTIVIWLSALYWHAKDFGQEITFDLTKIAKINPQKIDQVPLQMVLNNKWLKKSAEPFVNSQIIQAYAYFRYLLWLGEDTLKEEQAIKMPKFNPTDAQISIYETWEKFINSKNGNGLGRSKKIKIQELIDSTRRKMKVYTLIHEPLKDEPQAVIFDTLNGNRVQLEALDHVRNSVFVRLDASMAHKIFHYDWEPAENVLRDLKLKRQQPGVNFVYDYVISKGEKRRQRTINKTKGATHFTRMTRNLKDKKLADFLTKDLVPAMRTWPIVVRQRDTIEQNGAQIKIDNQILESISTIRELSTGPANPLILLYLSAHLNGELTLGETTNRLSLIENYLVRQILSNEPLSPLRSKIMDICGDLDGALDENSLKKALLDHGWVSDSTIKSDFAKRNLYEEAGPSALGAIFRGIEIHLSGHGANKFKVAKRHYTIEHIYPRKHEKWKADLKKWKTSEAKMDPYLHALGNLTVVTQKHNSTVGNKTLKEKQNFPTIPGNAAPLKIHEDWIKSDKWTEKEIEERSKKLINWALQHWKQI